MTAGCPRCRVADLEVLRERPEWTIRRCRTCSFVWRDTESGEIIDPDRRPATYQLDPDDIPHLRQVLPPPSRQTPSGEGST